MSPPLESGATATKTWIPDLSDRPGPRYLAIAAALEEAIRQGRLSSGDRLPTHRELARRLEVTIGTVSRAYAEAQRRHLISGEVGRGSFVLDPRGGSSREQAKARQADSDLLGLRFGEPEEDGGLIDFGLSVPPTPVHEEERRTLTAGFAALGRRPDLAKLLQSQPHAGGARHREIGARWIGERGLKVGRDQVLLSCGAQNGLTALFSTLADPGDVILTEELIYPGMKGLAELLRLRLEGLAMDEEGLRPDVLEEACRRTGSRLLFTNPTLQNPTGALMSESRRRAIAAIADRHGVHVVEDDVFGAIPADAPPPLSAFLKGPRYYLTSASKLVAPGMRIGFVTAPEEMIGRIGAALYATTWMASAVLAEVFSVWVEDGTTARFAEWKRTVAQERGALARRILSRARCGSHAQSFHLWLELPQPWKAEEFAALARMRGVALTPAEVFSTTSSPAASAVRICPTAVADAGRMERGLNILAELLEQGPRPTACVV